MSKTETAKHLAQQLLKETPQIFSFFKHSHFYKPYMGESHFVSYIESHNLTSTQR